jgi:two-component system sensor histidine kinase HydH
MSGQGGLPEGELLSRLKWLIFSRILFSFILLGSTAILQLRESVSFFDPPLLLLYILIFFIFCLSFFYVILFKSRVKPVSFAYGQIAIDTLVVTLIIFVTGSYNSVFSFLYLVVIIYTSILLYSRGSLTIAALCSLQYALLIGCEYYGMISPFTLNGTSPVASHNLWQSVYKVSIASLACFATAFLSSLLAEQARKSRAELMAMEEHVRRVDKMAAIGEMAAGLAHEIKNPLASLAGSIQLLREDIHLSDEHDRLMQIVLREADRLNSLVNDFLLFARPQAGKAKPIDMGAALAELVPLFKRDDTCRERIEVTTRLHDAVWVEMDPAHFHQVVWNLLLNAAEAIEGNGRITITTAVGRSGDALIQVADTGGGIPDSLKQTMFSPFVTTKPKGSGLGLSIVHRIVEAYGGRIDVESSEGQGTLFTLRMRSLTPPAAEPAREAG